MIRINLLPIRAAQKRESFQRQLVFMGIVFVIAFGFLAWIHFLVVSQIRQLNRDIAELKQQKKELEKTVGEVRDIDNKKAEVKRKLDIIKKLEASRLGPVRLMDELAETVPDKMWILSLTTQNDKINISGTALNNEAISEFMLNLRRSAYFENANLALTQASQIGGVKVMKFRITLSFKIPEQSKA